MSNTTETNTTHEDLINDIYKASAQAAFKQIFVESSEFPELVHQVNQGLLDPSGFKAMQIFFNQNAE